MQFQIQKVLHFYNKVIPPPNAAKADPPVQLIQQVQHVQSVASTPESSPSSKSLSVPSSTSSSPVVRAKGHRRNVAAELPGRNQNK